MFWHPGVNAAVRIVGRTTASRLGRRRTRGAAHGKGRPRKAGPGDKEPPCGSSPPGSRLPAARNALFAAKPAGNPLPRLPTTLGAPDVRARHRNLRGPLCHLGLAHGRPCGGGLHDAGAPHPPSPAHASVVLSCGTGRRRNGTPGHRRLGAQPLCPGALAGPWP